MRGVHFPVISRINKRFPVFSLLIWISFFIFEDLWIIYCRITVPIRDCNKIAGGKTNYYFLTRECWKVNCCRIHQYPSFRYPSIRYIASLIDGLNDKLSVSSVIRYSVIRSIISLKSLFFLLRYSSFRYPLLDTRQSVIRFSI